MDSAKVSRLAPLFYVSPNQINFVIPDATATGMATATIMNGDAMPPSTKVLVAVVAPGLFTANSQGTGVAAAIAIRRIIATQTDTEIPVFHCDANACGSDPIDLDDSSNVFLELFGTGIRGRTALANVRMCLPCKSSPFLAGEGALDQFTTHRPSGVNRCTVSVLATLLRCCISKGYWTVAAPFAT